MEKKKYWISRQGKEHGPYSKEELQNQDLTAETLVWELGTTKWKMAKEYIWYGYKNGVFIGTPGKNGFIDKNDKMFGIVFMAAIFIIVIGILISVIVLAPN